MILLQRFRCMVDEVIKMSFEEFVQLIFLVPSFVLLFGILILLLLFVYGLIYIFIREFRKERDEEILCRMEKKENG